MKKTTTELSKSKLVQNTFYEVQCLLDGEWKNYGELVMGEDSAFLNGEKLYHFFYEGDKNRCIYSFGKETQHRSGAFYFTSDMMGFQGSIQSGQDNVIVRGKQRSSIFRTNLINDKNVMMNGFDFRIEVVWDEVPMADELRSYYYLGHKRLDSSTITVLRDIKTGETKIEKTEDTFSSGEDTFLISIDWSGTEFKGEFTSDATEKTYRWVGTRANPITNYLSTISRDTSDEEIPPIHPNDMECERRNAHSMNPETSLQDLLNLSSIEVYTDKTVDVASEKAGEYFQTFLIDSLSKNAKNNLFIEDAKLDDLQKKIKDKYKTFYEKYSFPFAGNGVYEMLDPKNAKDKKEEEVFKYFRGEINKKKIDYTLKHMYEESVYSQQLQDLYTMGYKECVRGFKAYLADKPVEWAEKLKEHYLSPEYIKTWRTHVASTIFEYPELKVQEIYNKLIALDSSEAGYERAKDVCTTLCGSIFVVLTAKMRHNSENKELVDEQIKQVVEHMKELEQMEEEGKIINLIPMKKVLHFPQLTEILQKASAESEGYLMAGQKAIGELDRLGITPDASMVREDYEKLIKSILYGAYFKTILTHVIPEISYDPMTGGSIVTMVMGGFLGLGKINSRAMESMFKNLLGKLPQHVKCKLLTFSGSQSYGQLSRWFMNKTMFAIKILGRILVIASIALTIWDLASAAINGDTLGIIFDSLIIATDILALIFMFCPMAGPAGIILALLGFMLGLIATIIQLCKKKTGLQGFIEDDLKKAGYGPYSNEGVAAIGGIVYE